MARCLLLASLLPAACLLDGDDWPMLGRSQTRNAVSEEKNAPIEWDLKTGRNIEEYGIFPAIDYMGGKGMCSIAGYRDFIYVITGNGVDWSRSIVPSPVSPALMCLHKQTGALVWEDNSSGTNIIFGEFASPTIIEAGGVAQVIAPQGDGWLRSFDPNTGKLLWKFDAPKSARPKQEKNFFLNSAVFYEGRLFLAAGREVESGEGPGRLVCLDPTRRGDVSIELDDGPGKGKPNPNSAAVWHLDEFNGTMANAAIHQGLVIAVDFGGALYCVDAATGRKHWKHDLGAHVWGSPLIVDGKIYVGNEDGYVSVFELAREKKLLFRTEFKASVLASPILVNGVLYLVAGDYLYAIQQGASSPPAGRAPTP